MGLWGCVSRQLSRDLAAASRSCGPARVPGVLQLAEGRQKKRQCHSCSQHGVFPHIPLTQDLALSSGTRGWEERLSVSTERKDVVW